MKKIVSCFSSNYPMDTWDATLTNPVTFFRTKYQKISNSRAENDKKTNCEFFSSKFPLGFLGCRFNNSAENPSVKKAESF